MILGIAGILISMAALSAVHAFTTDEDEEIAQQYCINHASDILAGKNPITDLMHAGLITGFEGKTCSDVNSMIIDNRIQERHSDLMNEMAGLGDDEPTDLGELLGLD